MPKQNVRAYFDSSGNIKHIQENDGDIPGEIRELDQSGVDQLKEVSDFVIERNDDDEKPRAREILNSLNNDMSPKAESRLKNMKIRGPQLSESHQFGKTQKPKKNIGIVRSED